MSKKKKIKGNKGSPVQVSSEGKQRKPKEKSQSLLPWILPILLVTGICFFPMFNNSLTNWDDEYYVVQNALLRGPDWEGIFTKPVVSNYHPLTVASLALNYAISGLDPTSYFILNLLLHLANTGLVFYFIWLISGKRIWVAAFSSIVFGIHPMHVESVAWVSERKDVLYTLFFRLSLLSKPAAIILPLVLFLLDYWHGRRFSAKVIVEKIPFLILSAFFAYYTVMLQSKTAMASLDFYPLWTRFFFASYTSMMYTVRFFVPYPLSAFHPFPLTKELGLPIFLSPIFIVALFVFMWLKRRNKLFIFSILFFIINLILVLQIISIGGTLLAERYTYVPYIGLSFLIGMLLDKFSSANKYVLWGIPAAALLVFAVMTFQRTKVWKDSDTLWTNVIKHFPNASVARNNRANYLIRISGNLSDKTKQNELLQRALEDCNVTLKTGLNHARAYENRQNIYLRLNKDSLALADAGSLIRMEPRNRRGYYTKGAVDMRFNMPDSAIVYFNKCLEVDPNTDFALNNRGSFLFNNYKKYREAMADFTRAIQINPQGDYFLNRSYCHSQLGEIELAKNDATTAIQKGIAVPAIYRQLIKL